LLILCAPLPALLSLRLLSIFLGHQAPIDLADGLGVAKILLLCRLSKQYDWQELAQGCLAIRHPAQADQSHIGHPGHFINDEDNEQPVWAWFRNGFLKPFSRMPRVDSSSPGAGLSALKKFLSLGRGRARWMTR
jgi:hypothetical protein